MAYRLRLIAACAAFCAGGAVAATQRAPVVTYGAGGGSATVTPANIVSSSPSDFERIISGDYHLPGSGARVDDKVPARVGGKDIVVTSTRRISAKGVARVAARLLPGIGQALIVAEVAEAAWCYNTTGQLTCDSTVAEPNVAGYECVFSSYVGQGATAVAACTAAAQKYATANNRTTPADWQGCRTQYSFSVGAAGPSGVPVTQTTSFFGSSVVCNAPTQSTVIGHANGASAKVIKQCPAVPGFHDPRYHSPGGPANSDGKCPTGVPVSVSEAEWADRVEQHISPQNAPEVLKDAIDSGADATPQAGPQELSGPASVQGAPTSVTTTGPNGQPQTTTKTPTSNITYGGNSFTWNTTNITNNYDGSTTVEEKPSEEQRTECEVHPESAGCKELDPVDGPDLEKDDKQVSVTPDGGWGSDAGSCPPPVTASVLGQQIVIDNSLVCQFLGGIRFAVIGAFALAGVLIFIGGFKE